MLTEDRMLDIKTTNIFNNNEVKFDFENRFKSIEYYIIIHLSNAELYYIDEETLRSYENADLIQDTVKGRIYCFK